MTPSLPDLSLSLAKDLVPQYVEEILAHPMNLLWALEDPMEYSRLIWYCRAVLRLYTMAQEGYLLTGELAPITAADYDPFGPTTVLRLEGDEEEWDNLYLMDCTGNWNARTPGFQVSKEDVDKGLFWIYMEFDQEELVRFHENTKISMPLEAAVHLSRRDSREDEAGWWRGDGNGREIIRYEV